MKNVHLNFIHLCEAASMDSLSRLSLLGIFDRIYFHTIPGTFLKMTLVVNLTVSDAKTNYKFQINIAGPTGKLLELKQPIEANIDIPREKIKAGKAELGIILELANLEFKSFGTHQIIVLLDKQKVANIDLKVEKN